MQNGESFLVFATQIYAFSGKHIPHTKRRKKRFHTFFAFRRLLCQAVLTIKPPANSQDFKTTSYICGEKPEQPTEKNGQGFCHFEKHITTMEQRTLNISYECLTTAELTDDERRAIEAAQQSTAGSYAPYSHFSVGAAALLADGNIVIGSNQENAAFPSGICAERCAIFQAGAAHPDTPVSLLAIAARKSDGCFTTLPITPCGACRQVLIETEHRYGRPVTVLLYGEKEIYRLSSTYHLLPLHFDDDSM